MDTAHYKTLLEDEKKTLIEELTGLGHINPDNAADWELDPTDLDTMAADRNELADRSEERQVETSILLSLEKRYKSVQSALKRIEENTFGTCATCGESIEEDRLEANPAAETCKEHLEEVQNTED